MSGILIKNSKEKGENFGSKIGEPSILSDKLLIFAPLLSVTVIDVPLFWLSPTCVPEKIRYPTFLGKESNTHFSNPVNSSSNFSISFWLFSKG